VTAADPVTAVFAANLHRLRTGKGLSRTGLGRLAGVDPNSIGTVENGLGSTTLVTAGKIAAALGSDLPTMLIPGGGTPRDRVH
jgi:transcriptional regulator with XRE-family HTH domain